jgi:HSP20 family molecular chaperone IbpA
MKKPTFLERLTGATATDAYDEVLDSDEYHEEPMHHGEEGDFADEESEWHGDQPMTDDDPQEGELPVDMYQTGEDVVIRALIAGVSPDDLDISITRDMVTIKGAREEMQEAADDDYYHRELFWGSFSRTLLLPEEVLIDEAEAQEKHGLLEIRLPKVDKNRSTKLSVKSHAHK